MDQPATSLDRLNDLALPPEVSWWPLAPGWYGVIAIGLALLIWAALHTLKKWRKNAYRRQALQELKNADDPAAVAEILRRTALVFTPRETIASLSGSAWVDWLAEQSSQAISDAVRDQLASYVYRSSADAVDFGDLRKFAVDWIRSHRT